MFMIKKWIFLLVAFLIMTETIQSQTSVTLQDALNYALNNSEVLRQARLDIDNAHEVVTESKASALPQIGFNSSVTANPRSEEHTSELQSRGQLVCRLLLEKKHNL